MRFGGKTVGYKDTTCPPTVLYFSGPWALEHGYGAFDGGNTKKYQAWQKTVKNKFKRRLDGLGDGLVGAPPAAGSAATRELADSPQRAPTTTKAHHTPPAAQASSEQQHGAVRQRVLLPASVGEERDELMPQVRPPQPMPAPKAGQPPGWLCGARTQPAQALALKPGR